MLAMCCHRAVRVSVLQTNRRPHSPMQNNLSPSRRIMSLPEKTGLEPVPADSLFRLMTWA